MAQTAAGIQTDEQGRQFIDCTPTWEGLLPMLLELADPRNVQKDKRDETRQYIRQEFRRMAQAADKWNAHVKEHNNQTNTTAEA